jgi:hypothetical protein
MEPSSSGIAESIFKRIKPGEPVFVTVPINRFYSSRERLLELLTDDGVDWFSAAAIYMRKNLAQEDQETLARELFSKKNVVVISGETGGDIGVMARFARTARSMQGQLVCITASMFMLNV